MSPKNRTDLSRKDINFLRVVRAVCDNPEEFRGTDGGTGPATVTAVAEASNLSKEQVRYRMREGSRGLGVRKPEGDAIADDGGLGYIRIYEPPMTDRGYGPRSCEITKEGRRALADALEADEEMGIRGGDGTSPEAVEELREEIDELEDDLSSIQEGFADVFNTVENISDRMEEMDERDLGAVDDEPAERIRSVLRGFVGVNQMFKYMLGLNPADFGPNADLSPEKVAEVRGQMFDRLQRSDVGAVREEIAAREEVTVYDGGDDESDGGPGPQSDR